MKKKYYLSIGEPWDFNGPDGMNIIKGCILNKLSEDCIVFQSNNVIKFGDIQGNVFVLSPRYQNNRYENNNFSALPKLVTINGNLLLKDYDKSLSVKDLKDNSKFVVIGSLNKEPKLNFKKLIIKR